MTDSRDLEARLVALGHHLDTPEGQHLITAVTDRIAGVGPTRSVPTRRSLRFVAAVAAAVIILGALVIPPSRRAIGNLFRAGNVEVRSAKDFPEPSVTTTSTTQAGPGGQPRTIADAQRVVDFPVTVPDVIPPRTPTISVDPRVPGGIVTLDYGEFRVVETAAGPGRPTIAKGMEPGTRLRSVTVAGTSGLWITGTHHLVAYFDRDGNLRQDTVSEHGHVLLWARDGVTYRIEGFDQLADAQAVADAIPAPPPEAGG